MKKNYLFCLRLETEVLDNLKKQASEDGISVSELIRKKIKETPKLVKMELMLDQIYKKVINRPFTVGR